MGTTRKAKCRACGAEFEFSEGGGFQFAIINCNKCHLAKSISWEEKTAQSDHGLCQCGGTFTNEAKPRCIQCDSLQIDDLGVIVHFD